MSKRASSTKKSTPAAKKAKMAPADEEVAELPLDKWRVVVTGNFVVKPKAALEKALKDKGVSVTGSISGKTTHLILGKDGVNDYGKKTGVGSSKHTEAINRGLDIVREKEVWAILTGAVSLNELSDKKQASKTRATKSSKLPDKILFCVQEAGVNKISLPKLKQELESRLETKLETTRSKNTFKKVLSTLVEEGRLIKEGASYKLPDVLDANQTAMVWEKAQATGEDRHVDAKDKIKKYCPEIGKWRGLRVISNKKATGKATCKACGQCIEKGGQQLQVMDDSLFRMVVWPEDHHEGVSRGYVECGYRGYEVISRSKFFLHTDCQEAANQQFEEKFHRDWGLVRPHEVIGRGG